MDFTRALEIVTKDIQDTEKLVSNFKNYSRIPNIELNLALAKLQSVYDVLLMIRDEQGVNITDDHAKVITMPEISPEPLKEEIKPEPLKPEPVEKEVIRPDKEVEKREQTLPENKGVKTGETGKVSSGQGKILGEKYNSGKTVVHEKFRGSNPRPEISAPVRNIAASMGINDRFYYIRELFHGDAELFRQTMDTLDSSQDYNSALKYVTSRFNWKMDSEPAENLMNLVKRKFSNSINE